MKHARNSALLAAAIACACAAASAQPPVPAPQAGVAISRSVLATELIGMRVRMPNGERIGDVEDLVLSSGTIASAVVSVGGFLGRGAKRVEVPYDKLLLGRDASLVVSMSREEIEAMPAVLGVVVCRGAIARWQPHRRVGRAAADRRAGRRGAFRGERGSGAELRDG